MTKATLQGELVIAIDFDGTITTERDICDKPLVLRDNCKRVLTRLHEDGMKLILWTCRSGNHMKLAETFLEIEGLYDMFDAINDQLPEVSSMYPEVARKVGADIYVDDKGLGINLKSIWTDLEKLVYGGIK